PMKRAALIAVSLLPLALACTEKGRSVVLVDVKAGTLAAADKVTIYVTQGTQPLGHADGSGTFPLHLGVYLPKTVSGAVNVVACGFDSNGGPIGAGMPMPPTVRVSPG